MAPGGDENGASKAGVMADHGVRQAIDFARDPGAILQRTEFPVSILLRDDLRGGALQR